MIQVNRIYLIFNRLVTKKFLVDTSEISLSKLFTISNILKGTESTRLRNRGTSKPERQNERPVPYLNKYDTPASYILVFLESC